MHHRRDTRGRRRPGVSTGWGALAPLAALALVAGPAASAAQAATGAHHRGDYQLHLRLVNGDGAAHTATLTCEPDGGTHPDHATACDQLKAADGRIARIPAQPGACTMQYAPVRAGAVGHWAGRRLAFTDTFSNPCQAIRETGGVIFAF